MVVAAAVYSIDRRHQSPDNDRRVLLQGLSPVVIVVGPATVLLFFFFDNPSFRLGIIRRSYIGQLGVSPFAGFGTVPHIRSFRTSSILDVAAMRQTWFSHTLSGPKYYVTIKTLNA
jgi:hypothetical protein